jgi:septal ring factor EnvC (AmiA/AmiB activator)
VNFLRVILATLVIFATGALTGYFIAQKPASAATGATDPSVLASTNAPPDWNKRRDEMRASLQKEIKATDEQMAKVDEILAQSRKRSREIWQSIKVPMEAEVERVKDEIRGVLDEAQAAKYEEIMKNRGRFGPGGRDKDKKAQGNPQACRFNYQADRQCFL